MQLAVNRWKVWMAVLLGTTALAFACWLQSPPSKARVLRPLIADLDAYQATNGAYPMSCVSLASFSQTTQHVTIYTGQRDETNGVTWETREVSDHDFTVLVDRAGYEIFLPVGDMKMISFSSFPVWRIDSSQHRWQKGRIHWSIAGSYWSND
jgi:hypothetical protein